MNENGLMIFYLGMAILLLAIVLITLPTMVHGPKRQRRTR